MRENYERGWELAEQAGPAIRATRDMREGISAFLEKRPADFKGY